MTRVLVTGASGFIGAALAPALAEAGYAVRSAGRTPRRGDHAVIPTLSSGSDWRAALEGVGAVVHLAGPAHARPNAEGVRAIVEGAAALAAQAQAAGVTRFIYLSSIKAAGARTRGAPLRETDAPAPQDIYGRAKLEAERALAAHAPLRPVSLRPPLVFAPDAKANFAALLRLANSGAPLPFRGLANARSLIARTSLIEAVKAVLARADGPAGAFFIADRPALSTAEMVAAMRAGLGRPANLFAAPLVRRALPAPLRESLVCDDAAFRAAYGYGPRAGADAREDLAACARAWRGRA